MTKASDTTKTNKVPTILVAEDDKFLLQILYDKLTREDFKVIKANNGSEALEKIKSEHPDLVLLDLIMPLKNGFEVLEGMKKQDIDIPVIVLSNLGQDTDIEKSKKLGAVDYLIKADNSIKSIIAKVRDHLGKASKKK